MADESSTQRIKFDLPEAYARAVRARAAYDGVYPRDVVIAALDAYLGEEIALAKRRLAQAESSTSEPTKGRKKRETSPDE